jgi:thioredoxin-related protein
MRFVLFVIFGLVSQITLAQSGIRFNREFNSVEDFLAQIKKNKKPSLLVAYSSTCDVCGHMDTAVYRNAEVSKFYNKNFECYKVDLESELGSSFTAKYHIYGYPSYLFFNANGIIVHRQKGGFPVKEFIELGKDVLNPEKQFLSASFKFKTGIRNTELCRNLAESAKEMDDVELMKQCVVCYLESEKNWGSEVAMKFILEFINEIKEPHFQYLISNRSAFEKALGAGKVSEKVDNIILKDLAYASYDSETEQLDISKMRSFGLQYLPPVEVEKSVALFQANEFMRRNDSLAYIKAIIAYFDSFPSSNGFLLTNLSQGISELTDEPKYLAKALEYAVKAIEYLKSENCYLVAATIAMQLHDTPKAMEILTLGAQHAIAEKKSFKTVNLYLEELKSNN